MNTCSCRFIGACFSILIAILATQALAASNTSTCGAEITVNATYPSTAFYIYYEIIVENTGLCDITNLSVDITLPPGDSAFAYYNISATGELLGLVMPMAQGSVQIGGVVVLNSARIPYIQLGSVECSNSCNAPTATVPPTLSTVKLEVLSGSNPWWVALQILENGEATELRRVEIRDSSSNSWRSMSYENWNSPVYTYAATESELILPISMRLISTKGQVLAMEDIITSFANAVIDSGMTYNQTSKRGIYSTPDLSSTQTSPIIEPIQLAIHPSSKKNMRALIPYNARTEIQSISLKSANSQWVQIESQHGVFEFAANIWQLPVSVKLTSVDNNILVLEDILTSFGTQIIQTSAQF